MTGFNVPSFMPAAVIDSWPDLFARMKQDLISKNYCEPTLFLGKKADEFPMYAGYAVGFGLVDHYLSNNSLSAVDCVCLPAAELLEL